MFLAAGGLTCAVMLLLRTSSVIIFSHKNICLWVRLLCIACSCIGYVHFVVMLCAVNLVEVLLYLKGSD